jgi:hypothetical protein
MTANRWPQVGDEAVEFRAGARSWEQDSAGSVVRVKTITSTLVITSDGGKYNRDGLFPINEGRQSARRLVPAVDERVLCVRGRRQLGEVARQVENLSRIERKDPMEIVAAFAQIISTAADARREFISLTSAASKAEQESER